MGGLLRDVIDRKRCTVLSSDVRIRIAASGLQTYPDVSVVCGKPKFGTKSRDSHENPVLIVEVLSPTTEAYDRGGKFAEYKLIESLREYLLVSQAGVRVELFRKQPDGTWSAAIAEGLQAELRLDSVGVTMRLADIYEGIELV